MQPWPEEEDVMPTIKREKPSNKQSESWKILKTTSVMLSVYTLKKRNTVTLS